MQVQLWAAFLSFSLLVPALTFPTRTVPLSFNPAPENLPAATRELKTPDLFSTFKPLTNAERMAAGLNPNPPRRRHSARTGHDPLVARVPSPSAVSSAIPIIITGTIQAVGDYSDGDSVKFVSSALNSFGEYGLTADETQALNIRFSYFASDSDPFNVVTPDGSFFGGIVGYASEDDDLNSGSSNYAYLGDIAAPTPDYSSPAYGSNTFTTATTFDEKVETAIWTYDSSSHILSPQWINIDHSTPETAITSIQGDLALTGDSYTFRDTFGGTDSGPLIFYINPTPRSEEV